MKANCDLKKKIHIYSFKDIIIDCNKITRSNKRYVKMEGIQFDKVLNIHSNNDSICLVIVTNLIKIIKKLEIIGKIF